MRTLLFATLFAATPVDAADVAVLVGNHDYRLLPDVPGAEVVDAASRAFQAAGYITISGTNLRANALSDVVDQYSAAHSVADRVVVVLAGHFFVAGGQTYYLPVDSRIGSLGAVLTSAVPLSSILGLLADHPGQSLLLLAGDKPGRDGEGVLWPGIRLPDVPQGVAIGVGTPETIAAALAALLGDAEISVADLAARPRGVIYSGYLSPDLTLASRTEGSKNAAEDGFWQAADLIATTEAFQAYLDQYPGGVYALQAQQRLDAAKAASEN
ncbi:MAG: caspase family protein [Pseudomonadota bacterium]